MSKKRATRPILVLSAPFLTVSPCLGIGSLLPTPRHVRDRQGQPEKL